MLMALWSLPPLAQPDDSDEPVIIFVGLSTGAVWISVFCFSGCCQRGSCVALCATELVPDAPRPYCGPANRTYEVYYAKKIICEIIVL